MVGVRISVIIPTLNEAAHIERTVRSAWQAGATEVIVTDGGSNDGTGDLVARLNCTLVRSPRGRGIQQNSGANAATGDVLLFLHADNWLEGVDLCSQVRAALADTRRLHGAMRQRIDAAQLAYRLLERGNAARVRWCGLPYGDQAIFMRREIFWRLGGFPEVPLMEDLLLMQQARRLAWPALIEGKVVVSPRRWQRHGIVGQTLRNWGLIVRHSLGASPESLAGHYPRHDERPAKP